MTIRELQRRAMNGQGFVTLTVKGRRVACRWVDVRRGLFNVESIEGRPVKGECLCDLQGSPDAPVVEADGDDDPPPRS